MTGYRLFEVFLLERVPGLERHFLDEEVVDGRFLFFPAGVESISPLTAENRQLLSKCRLEKSELLIEEDGDNNALAPI